MIKNNIHSLICPKSGQALSLEKDRLISDQVSYPIRYGVPDFIETQIDTSELFENVQIDYTISSKPWVSPLSATYVELTHNIEHRKFKWVAEHLKRKIRILDIGCGCSKFTHENRSFTLIRENASYYAAVEPSWEMLSQSISEQSILPTFENFTLVRGVGEALPFPDDSFDLIIIKSTLDHCHDAEKTIQECFRVLAPGGTVLITLQNFRSWQRRLIALLMPGKYKRHRKQDHHASPFWPGKLKQLLLDQGFQEIEMSGLGYLSLSRYKLQWLEELITFLPKKLLSDASYLKFIQRAESTFFKLLPGYCGSFVTTAIKPQQ